jgi:hypothetical protein
MFIGGSPYDERRSARGFGGARRIEIGKVAADHGAHETPSRRFGDRSGHYRPAVLEHGDAIRNCFDLRHSMGDIDDRHAFLAQARDEIEQTRRVIAIEGGVGRPSRGSARQWQTLRSRPRAGRRPVPAPVSG